jgi:hypothetical protein
VEASVEPVDKAENFIVPMVKLAVYSSLQPVLSRGVLGSGSVKVDGRF